MGKLLIIVGVVCILVGVFITYSPKVPFLGKLPGDIRIEKENFRLYFPLATSLVISALLSLIVYLYNRYKN